MEEIQERKPRQQPKNITNHSTFPTNNPTVIPTALGKLDISYLSTLDGIVSTDSPV